MKNARSNSSSYSKSSARRTSESASDLTKSVIMIASLHGCDVWRQNNHATKGRKFIGRLGVPDVLGFCKLTGIMIALEVKGEGDRLSPEQIEFLDAVNKAGGIGIEVRNSREFTKIFLERLREKRSLVLVNRKQHDDK